MRLYTRLFKLDAGDYRNMDMGLDVVSNIAVTVSRRDQWRLWVETMGRSTPSLPPRWERRTFAMPNFDVAMDLFEQAEEHMSSSGYWMMLVRDTTANSWKWL